MHHVPLQVLFCLFCTKLFAESEPDFVEIRALRMCGNLVGDWRLSKYNMYCGKVPSSLPNDSWAFRKQKNGALGK
jgi:hypothetical protein